MTADRERLPRPEVLAGKEREVLRLVGALGRRFPEYFLRVILGYDVKEGVHDRWFRAQVENQRTILLAPRGHGKSTVCNIGYVLWNLVNNRDLRILIASKTARQAELFLGEIRAHLERNTIFRAVYGDWVRKDQWREDQIVIPRVRIAKEPTITTIGIGGSLPSWHFDVIIIDDPHDLTNSRTAGQRELVWQWFLQVCSPTLEPHGKMHLIGTRWNAHDLFGRVMATDPRFVVIHEKAIRDDGTLLWSEKFTREELEKERQKSPWAFALQYQCEVPTGIFEGPVFHAEDFELVSPEEARELADRAIYVVQAWDLAVGKEILAEEGEGDFTAGVTVALLPDMRFLVLDWWRGRPGLSGQIKAIKEQAGKWGPDVIGIEAVAYQAVLSHHLATTTPLPIKPIRPDSDKIRRAWSIQTYVEERRVLLNSAIAGLRDILAAFPYGEEDDSVDAFVYAMMLAARRERLERIEREMQEAGVEWRRRGI